MFAPIIRERRRVNQFPASVAVKSVSRKVTLITDDRIAVEGQYSIKVPGRLVSDIGRAPPQSVFCAVIAVALMEMRFRLFTDQDPEFKQSSAQREPSGSLFCSMEVFS